jgi:hypothetical protein
VKLVSEALPDYEYVFRQPEFVGTALKYDNRVFALERVGLWAAVRNSLVKTAASAGEVPDNPASELRAEAYAELFAP